MQYTYPNISSISFKNYKNFCVNVCAFLTATSQFKIIIKNYEDALKFAWNRITANGFSLFGMFPLIVSGSNVKQLIIFIYYMPFTLNFN